MRDNSCASNADGVSEVALGHTAIGVQGAPNRRVWFFVATILLPLVHRQAIGAFRDAARRYCGTWRRFEQRLASVVTTGGASFLIGVILVELAGCVHLRVATLRGQ